MGDVIVFPSRGAARPDADTEKFLDSLFRAEGREAERRVRIYASGDVSAALLRILALYPMFKLTHATRTRRCVYCGHRIAPLELHFVHGGVYLCQSGTCMDKEP